MNSLKMTISSLTKFICVLILALIVNARAWDTKQIAYRDSNTYNPTTDESDDSNCQVITLTRHESYHQRKIRLVYNVQPIPGQWVNIKMFEGPNNKVVWSHENVPVNQTIDLYETLKVDGPFLHLCFYINGKNAKRQYIDWSLWE